MSCSEYVALNRLGYWEVGAWYGCALILFVVYVGQRFTIGKLSTILNL